jgi:glyoxylase-like metal-dependent hydrolase (beta-lactamase superfamily II)
LTPADIPDVLVTHIHLDHAGAAGWWARQGATVHVHHVGAPHLINPERLLASAGRIYGDRLGALWGEFLAAPAGQVHALHDGDLVEAGGLQFLALDTPGHAGHHMVYQVDDIAFVGDLAGVRRPGVSHVRLPTPPPEFDLAQWLASIDQVRSRRLARIYLTHFGAVEEVDAHWDTAAALVREYADRVHKGLTQGAGRDAIVAEFVAWEQSRLQADGVAPEEWEAYANIGPVGMSVDGLIRYWQKRSGG